MPFEINGKFNRRIATLALSGLLLAGGAGNALAGVTGCSAPGRTQEGGAVVGAILGGIIGNQVGGRHAGGETLAGAAVGAAAGSAIGCEVQKDRRNDARVYRSETYSRDGYRLSSDIRPARYERIAETYVADRAVTLRAGPNGESDRVGGLRRGERFQALAAVRNSDWILVGRGGVGVGYVRGDLVRPAGERYAYDR
jgi:hypothetical protein